MRLLVMGRYRNGPVSYTEGQIIEVSDAEGEFLQRDSPGTFAREEVPEVAAITAETTTGLTAPDRRARGGQRR